VAFVLFRSGVLLIDADGVSARSSGAGALCVSRCSAASGKNQAEDQRRERVRVLLRLQEDMGYMAKDVSEVNAGDPENIRIVAQVENRAVELMMGDGNFAERYQNFWRTIPRSGSGRRT